MKGDEPVFPVTTLGDNRSGMITRDWLAATFAAAMISNPAIVDGRLDQKIHDYIRQESYRMADDQLKQSEVQP